MSEIDYTEIRDNRIRMKICHLMSEMLDSPDDRGIYPTSKFMWKMETFILSEVKELREALGDFVAYLEPVGGVSQVPLGPFVQAKTILPKCVEAGATAKDANVEV